MLRTPTLALTLSLAALCASAAGRVDVSFDEPRKFSDAGRSAIDTERTTQTLAEHLQRLGKRLPDNQTLRVEVLDVDLAGRVIPRPRADVRVLNGGADWPHIKLRYTLTADGRTLKSGEETLSDLNYLGTPQRSADGNMPYETRMLTQWFEQRFGGAPAHASAKAQ